jgi:hypothetical protein
MKPGVFTQLYVQIVFAVENRQCQLRNKEYNEQIFQIHKRNNYQS